MEHLLGRNVSYETELAVLTFATLVKSPTQTFMSTLDFIINMLDVYLFVCLFMRAPEVTNRYCNSQKECPWCGIRLDPRTILLIFYRLMLLTG